MSRIAVRCSETKVATQRKLCWLSQRRATHNAISSLQSPVLARPNPMSTSTQHTDMHNTVSRLLSCHVPDPLLHDRRGPSAPLASYTYLPLPKMPRAKRTSCRNPPRSTAWRLSCITSGLRIAREDNRLSPRVASHSGITLVTLVTTPNLFVFLLRLPPSAQTEAGSSTC